MRRTGSQPTGKGEGGAADLGSCPALDLEEELHQGQPKEISAPQLLSSSAPQLLSSQGAALSELTDDALGWQVLAAGSSTQSLSCWPSAETPVLPT